MDWIGLDWVGLGLMDGSPGGQRYRAPYGANNNIYSPNCWLHISIFLKVYIPQPYPRTLIPSDEYPTPTYIFNLHILPKLFAAYIQHKDIFWNIYIPQPCTRLTFIPRTVGMIYPIPTYILNWHIFPKLLAAYIQYKYIFQQIYIPQHCAQRAHRNSNNTCSPQVSAWYIQYPRIYSTDIYSPNFWLHISNNKFIFFKCERHTRRSLFFGWGGEGTPIC